MEVGSPHLPVVVFIGPKLLHPPLALSYVLFWVIPLDGAHVLPFHTTSCLLSVLCIYNMSIAWSLTINPTPMGIFKKKKKKKKKNPLLY